MPEGSRPPASGGKDSDPPRTVVYVSVLPPGGGIATWTAILFERGLPGGWQSRLVDSRVTTARREFEPGTLNPAELRRAVRILRLLWAELGTAALVHLNVGSFRWGLARDLLGVWLARLRGVPAVLHYHGNVGSLAGEGGTPLQRFLLRRAVRRASLNLVMNEPSRRYLETLVGSRGGAVVSLPNFFDERELASRPTADTASGPARVLFVANLTPAKGVLDVIEVARALPGVEFHLIGVAPDEMGSRLRAAPRNVRIHGPVARAALLRAYREAQLLLFPSREEGFPFAVLEAMALGLPVVATKVGAIPEMVEEGRGGFLCPPDPGSLSAAVRRILDDEPLRQTLGRFNREKALRLYAYPVVAEQLARLYDQLAARTPPARRARR
ncbi:MAG: glycosyltransferase family 4 protein [Myxococcota bacterium]